VKAARNILKLEMKNSKFHENIIQEFSELNLQSSLISVLHAGMLLAVK